MNKQIIRDDWRPYRADDPATWPEKRPGGRKDYLWVTCAYVEHFFELDVERRVVSLAGDFDPKSREDSKFRSVYTGAGIPDVVAWCWQQTPDAWDGE